MDATYFGLRTHLRSGRFRVACCAYIVEPQGPLMVDPAAWRLALLCIFDISMDRDSPEITQGMMLAAATCRCEAAKVLRVLVVPDETRAAN